MESGLNSGGQSERTDAPAPPEADNSSGLWEEFRTFLMQHKLWWIAPILIVLAAVGALLLMSDSAFAPFIYPVF